jgi:glucose-6-phosphate isomerase
MQFIIGGSGKISFTSIADNDQAEEKTLENPLTSGLVEGLQEKSQGQLAHYLFSSLNLAKAGNFNENRSIIVPNTSIDLDKSSPRALGEFMQFKMMETMYLGDLMHVNAFDNPGVDAYKKGFLELVKKTPAQQKEDIMRLIEETYRVINRNL